MHYKTSNSTPISIIVGILTPVLTCNEKDLNAGMGIRAAMKKANILLNDVKNTLTPVLARQYSTGSWDKKK